jgi:hypothetical protein
LRTLSKQTGVAIEQLKKEERPNSDLTISQLLCWQSALKVPLVDLLVDSDGPLSKPVAHRAQLIRIMKTAGSIDESVTTVRACRLTKMLKEQLTNLMPELAEIGSWPSVGSQKQPVRNGRQFEQPTSLAPRRPS